MKPRSPPMRRNGLAAAVILASALAGAPTWAAEAAPRLNLSLKARPALEQAVFTPRRDEAGQSRVARTAVEHRFDTDGLTGQLGYLCGLHTFPPGSSRDGGPASAF